VLEHFDAWAWNIILRDANSNRPELVYGSVCTGIASAAVAWRCLGWHPAWFSEIAPFPSAVLAHRYPTTVNLGDANHVHERKEAYQPIDILVGGTPCQSFSKLGNREGLRDERGRLALRLIETAAILKARWIVLENVDALLSCNQGWDFAAILGALANSGYSCSWRVLDAKDFGLAAARARLYVVGHRNPKCAEAVLAGAGSVSSTSGTHKAVALRREAGSEKAIAYAIEGKLIMRKEWNPSNGNGLRPELSFCLTASDRHAVIHDGVARYLTPVDCERLQGFPDNYTKIPYEGKDAWLCPDSLRYQAIGNAIAVPVLRWIGQRITAVDEMSKI
jgi:DNA (cytosine-5)-methyltransferase 1